MSARPSADALRARLRFYAITPDAWASPDEYAERVARALELGVTCVQFRDKRARSEAEKRACAEATQRACAEAGALFIVNDDDALALALGADGVHVGPSDRAVAEVRARVGEGMLIGGSAGTLEAAGALVEQGVDYLGVGAIFEARVSKPNASAPRGVEVLRALRGAHPALPFVAIGGVEAETAGACLAAGADGVAVIRAAWGAGAPALARALSR